ncbi:MAG: hypothetical protein GYA36_18965 [Veillonellaceae bacterium]|nr:hypothetical protein [Veillonellaceae bacterium]
MIKLDSYSPSSYRSGYIITVDEEGANLLSQLFANLANTVKMVKRIELATGDEYRPIFVEFEPAKRREARERQARKERKAYEAKEALKPKDQPGPRKIDSDQPSGGAILKEGEDP